MSRAKSLQMEVLETRLPLANSAQVLNSGVFTLPGNPDELQTVQVRRIDGGGGGNGTTADPTTLIGFVPDDATGSLDSLDTPESYEVKALARARNRLVYFGDELATYRVKGGSPLSFGLIGDQSLAQWLRESVVDPRGSNIGFLQSVGEHSTATLTTRGDKMWQMDWQLGGETFSYELLLDSDELDASIMVESFVASQDADTEPGPTLNEGDTVELSYTVTNPGSNALSNVAVVDDNGTPDNPTDDITATPSNAPSGVNVGDFNANNLLDPGETWLFTAQSIARPGQITSSGTASGEANGTTTTACDEANYFVDAARLPDISIASFISTPEATAEASDGTAAVLLAGTEYAIQPVIENTGGTTVNGPFTVEVSYRGTTEVVDGNSVLEPGDELTLDPFVFTEEELGEFALTFRLDPNDVIDENDESDESNQLEVPLNFIVLRPSRTN